jgi:MFS family permease
MDPTRPGELPGGRWLLTSVFVHAVAEFSVWITVLVVAFDRGGPSAAGLAVTAQLVPAAVLAPVVGAAGDRFPRQRVLAVSFLVLAAAAGGCAAALVLDTPLVVLYGFAALFTVATIATPATIASLLVHHARTPTQLTSWNISRSFARAAGSLIGPLLTAVLLAVAEPTVVFVVLAACCAVMGVVAGVRLPDDDRLPSQLSARAVLGDSWRGVSYIATAPAPRRIVAYIGATELLVGALDLIFVGVAFDQLGRGGSTVALIAVAFAIGTMLAVSLASRRPRWQLSRLITAGAALLTIPLLVVSEANALVAVLALAGLLGAGNGLVEIGTQTLLQRSCTETMTSRAYGALDSTTLITAAVGAAIAGQLIADGDLTDALAVFGLGGAIVLMGGGWRLRSTERSLRPTDNRLVASFRSVSFLASLPQPTLDRLARGAQRRMVPSGRPVVVEGEPGDEFFVLVTGGVQVHVRGEAVGRLHAPASFGEVALLHDTDRSATVITTEPCEFAVIRQAEFLDAVGRTASSHRGALDAAQQYGLQTSGDDPTHYGVADVNLP